MGYVYDTASFVDWTGYRRRMGEFEDLQRRPRQYFVFGTVRDTAAYPE
jgi:hypothetical protein